MIYTKTANFPYPILTKFNTGYVDGDFDMELHLDVIGDDYVFTVTPIISSTFIEELLKQKKAQLYMIVKDKESMFFPLEKRSKIHIPTKRLSIKDNPQIQLMIQACENISYKDNNDLESFYDHYKADIIIEKGKLLGYSKVAKIRDLEKQGYDLFEIAVDENLDSEVKIEVNNEVIKIVCKSTEIGFSGIENGDVYQYPYIYMGLQKALIAFLSRYSTIKDSTQEIQDAEIDFTKEQIVADGNLFIKLEKLMESKGIEALSFDNIDEVIYQITDHIIGSYAKVLGDKDYEDI